MDEASLTPEELRRYSRHLLMPEVGVEGQQRLKTARVLCVGAGGLGSPASMYLAAAGVGTIGLVDFDRVDESNLQRQVLYSASDVGRSKLAVAAARLRSMNPHINIVEHEVRFNAENAASLVTAYHIVVDGTDNFATRYLVNDACVLNDRPNVYGSIFRFEGQVSVFAAEDGPCYRCLHPDPPPPGLVPNCAEAGVLGVLPGIIGTIQANEAIKLILGIGEPLVGRFLIFDALAMRFRELRLRRAPDCPVCGEHPTITALRDYDEYCDGVTALASAAERARTAEGEVTVEELRARMDSKQPFFLLDVREPYEQQICRIPGAELIPMGEVTRRTAQLPHDRDIIVMCRSGQRSARVAQYLRSHGFERVHNLEGGILAWIDRIDPSQPKY
jgi:sulfur-carrier protein adenylyltransferase/sulfurtransferase